jgi:hypothetical protein
MVVVPVARHEGRRDGVLGRDDVAERVERGALGAGAPQGRRPQQAADMVGPEQRTGPVDHHARLALAVIGPDRASAFDIRSFYSNPELTKRHRDAAQHHAPIDSTAYNISNSISNSF